MSLQQIKPPDMGILKDPTQHGLYISGLERWANLQKAAGTSEEILADIVLTHSFEQNLPLTKEMTDHFQESLSNNKNGIKEMVAWLRTKYGLNKHSDMLRILSNFLNTCRRKSPPESIADFITRFETNYAEVKKMGETFSSTCLSIMLLRASQLTDTDSQIVAINLEFDPKAADAKKQFDETKAALRKFQHTKTANNLSNPGMHTHTAQPTKTFLAALEDDEELDDYQKADVHNQANNFVATYMAQLKTQKKKFPPGGGPPKKDHRRRGPKKWKCEYCLCHHRITEECSCACTTHPRESCPNPDQTKVAAYKKRKADRDAEMANKRQQMEQGTSGVRSYITYASDFTEKLAEQEDDYSYTLLAKVVAETTSDTYRPLDELLEALGVEPEDGAVQSPPPRPDVVEPGVAWPVAPVSQIYDVQQGVQVSQGGTGADLQVNTSANVKLNANSLSFHDNNTNILSDIILGETENNETDEANNSREDERDSIEVEQCWSPGYLWEGGRRPEGATFQFKTDYAHAEDPLANAATLSQKEAVFLRTDEGQRWQDTLSVSKELHKLFLLIDTGSPSTLCGVEDFKLIKRQYTEMIQSTFLYKPSNKKYEFGGGEKTYSMGTVRLPIYVLDINRKPHILHVWVEVVNQKNLPLLLGGRSLVKAKGTICFKELTLAIDWRQKRLTMPIKQVDTGHFHLQFFPMSEEEDKLLVREMVDKADWSDSEVESIITYLAAERQPDITKIKSPHKINKQKADGPLTKQQVIHVHQALGHVHRNTLRDMVKKTKLWNNDTLRFIEELEDCEICAVEHNRPPKPRIAAPRSSNFNHVLAIDLKENKRYSNAPPYILYMVDTFTRFKAAVFIKNKQGSTIAEHLVLEWVKLHGAPKYLMSDRGTEFINTEMRDFCQFHGIRFTSSASYSPHQNAYVERGHAVADRALERMITADPSLKPQVALAWVIQAANTLQNVSGLTPFQLVFGRLPRHPTLVEDNPGADQEIADSQATWARHYRMMMAARESFVAAESDRVLRKALQQRTYTDPSRVQVKDWVYWRRNNERYWKGPAKVNMVDGKNIHMVFHGQPMLVNRDDVLLSKPETEEFTLEQFVTLPSQHQPPHAPRPDVVEPGVVPVAPVSQNYDAQQGVLVLPRGPGATTQVRLSDLACSIANSNSFHGNNNERLAGGSRQTEQGQDQERESDVQPGQINNEDQEGEAAQPSLSLSPDSQTAQSDSQTAVSQPCQSQQQRECPDQTGLEGQQSPANSTQSASDLGTPLQCNLCEKETSSRNFQDHCLRVHGLQQVNLRQHSKVVQTKPDSIYENASKLKKGVVVVDDAGNYLTLVKPTPTGWTTQNINTKAERDLELIRDMVDMRFIGSLESETEEGINVINLNNEQAFVEFGDYSKKVFFTALTNYHEDQVYVVNIPRSKHGEPACVAAKAKELRDYENFEVFEVVDRPDSDNIISTEWVLVEKEKQDGTKVTKARLCIRGDQEQALHNIPRESPTVNKISVKLLVTLAISQGWDIRSCDVERAFLQSDPIEREVFVRPPVEMNLPRGKVLQLKKTAYGLVDASRAFYLKQAKELKNIGFHPLSMDPAMFIHKSKGQEMCDAGAAVHVDDAMTAGKADQLDKAQQQLEQSLKYGSVETLPFRFLGSNYKRLRNGDIVIDQQHYVDAMEIPEMPELSKLKKAEILPDKLQSVFRSLASKLNVLAATVRPDYTYAAKYLTTRYNKATKSDMTRAIKLIKEAKQQPTQIIIPNVGQPEKWILAGVVDASHHTAGNLFAVGGHVVMIINKETLAASVIHWSSRKIERVVHSSAAAETIAMQKMFSTIYLVRKILTEMCGARVSGLQCVALTDHQGLWSNIHHIKANPDDWRLHADVIEIRQSIEQDETVQEVRYVHSSLNLADCLTKSTKSGHMLLQVVRTGQYDIPGGVRIRDSTLTSVRTWNQLMRVEQQDPDLHSANSSADQPAASSSHISEENNSEVSVLYDSGRQQQGWKSSASSSSAPQSSPLPSSQPGSSGCTRTSSRPRGPPSTPRLPSTRTPSGGRSTPSQRIRTAAPPGSTRTSRSRSTSRSRNALRTAKRVSFQARTQ